MTTPHTTPELLPCPFCGDAPSSMWCGVQFHGADDSGYWGIDCCHCHVHAEDEASAVAQWNTRAATQTAKAAPVEGVSEKDMDEVMKQRDYYHDVADDLASQIAAITGEDIGEHSSSNNPWQNAANAATEYRAPPPLSPPDTGNVGEAPKAVERLIEELDERSARMTQYTNNPLDGLLSAAADALRDAYAPRPNIDGDKCRTLESDDSFYLEATAAAYSGCEDLYGKRHYARLLQISRRLKGGQGEIAILFEHEDGRYAVNPDTTGDPKWHRLGPVALPTPGRGMVPMTEEDKCETCGGRGQVTARERVGESDFNEWELDCPVCDGAGRAPGHIQTHVAFLNSRISALKREAHDWWSAAAKAGPATPEVK